MPWSGSAGSQTYARTDGTRNGTQVWQQAQGAGVKIISTAHDTHDQDVATALNLCLKKDGGNTATADIPMGGFNLTGMGDAAALTESVSAKQVQNSSILWGGTAGGTANALTLTLSPAPTAYAAGQVFRFIASAVNTGACTLDVNSLGAKNIYRGSIAIVGYEFKVGWIYEVVYDGTQFQLLTQPAKTGIVESYIGITAPAGALFCSGLTVGNASSGGTARANADTEALFGMLWDNFSNTVLAIQNSSGAASTRGASAAADFAANKRMPLPDLRGRVIVGLDTMGGSAASRVTSAGSGIDATLIGNVGGAQNHTLTIAESAAHDHGGATGSGGAHNHTYNATDSGINFSSGSSLQTAAFWQASSNTSTASNHTHTITSQGGGGAHNNMQPSYILFHIIWM